MKAKIFFQVIGLSFSEKYLRKHLGIFYYYGINLLVLDVAYMFQRCLV